jgi:hypothetical protein
VSTGKSGRLHDTRPVGIGEVRKTPMISLQANTPKRVFMAVIALVAWFALLIQFPLTIATARANGMMIVWAVTTYFSFFTILTNLLVALGLTLSLWMPNSALGSYFSRPAVTSATAAYIAMVGACYSLLLRHLWDPEGLQKTADIILHDAVPVLYVIYWLVFVPKSPLRWKIVLWWLIYPLAYLFFVLVRGALVGRYPYPFIDAGALGYSRALSNAALLLCAFLTLGLFVIALGRWMGRGGRMSNVA